MAENNRPAHDFKHWKSSNNQYYWVYYDGNYEALVTSETYTTFEDAKKGLNNFLQEMRDYLA